MQMARTQTSWPGLRLSVRAANPQTRYVRISYAMLLLAPPRQTCALNLNAWVFQPSKLVMQYAIQPVQCAAAYCAGKVACSQLLVAPTEKVPGSSRTVVCARLAGSGCCGGRAIPARAGNCVAATDGMRW